MGKFTVVCVVAVAGALGFSACSETTRYRTLSFFLDGVPPPGAPRGPAAAAPLPSGPAGEPASPPPAPRFIPHTPYRENRCQGCHDVDSGQLIRSVQEGLCVTCHAELVSRPAFIHGPVAVNDCTVCHHYHAASLPNLLLAEVTPTCLNCHDRDDLSTGEYHVDLQRGCTDCHDPHELGKFLPSRLVVESD